MNLAPDDPEIGRLTKLGWRLTSPHKAWRPRPQRYRRYLASATGEFTAIKGVDVSWQTGWISDRAAAFLALGRPVITESSGAEKFLPTRKRNVLRQWPGGSGRGSPANSARGEESRSGSAPMCG